MSNRRKTLRMTAKRGKSVGRRGSNKSVRKRRARNAERDSAPSVVGGTLGEWLRYIGANLDEADWIPAWPPDAFAIGASLLRRTGGYLGFVNGSLSRRKTSDAKSSEAGRTWRDKLASALREGSVSQRLRDSCPPDIRDCWAHMRRCANKSIAECADDQDLLIAAGNLCIVSDAACDGIGVAINDDPFLAVAQAVLVRNETRSFCLHIPTDKLAVLGKQHTPQRGCTIRSLTHNLALYIPTEINAYWSGPYTPAGGDLDVCNLLLLPWPTKVSTGDFSMRLRRDGGLQSAANLLSARRYFDYSPQISEQPKKLAARVARAVDAAEAQADKIHAIVLPELALTPEQFQAIESVAVKRRAILISGMRGPASAATNGMPVNACAIQPVGLTGAFDEAFKPGHRLALDSLRCVQYKHHRWCLDRQQILQYELGARLPASRDCWERIYIGQRDINFVTLGSWLTMCVLICEDLARQDPVTEVIRAVGPNIVFALLMDGPQLRNRWPSRYASVLAEDPGCSVLSLTNIGMAKRSRLRGDLPNEVDRNSTIALWRDAIYGEREIAVEPGHDACILSLVCKTAEEVTIDGRGDEGGAHFPVFAGAQSFRVEP